MKGLDSDEMSVMGLPHGTERLVDRPMRAVLARLEARGLVLLSQAYVSDDGVQHEHWERTPTGLLLVSLYKAGACS